MSSEPSKRSIRRNAQEQRRLQGDKEEHSLQALQTAWNLPELARSRTLMFYVDVRDELRTQAFLRDALRSPKQIVVPWCCGTELKLFRLESMNELECGRFGILEPRGSLRADVAKQISPGDVDAVLVPGVAFSPEGARLGHGHGFYDRLLDTVRPECVLVGMAFDCQIVEQIPMESHDVFMDFVVTEKVVYECKGPPTTRNL